MLLVKFYGDCCNDFDVYGFKIMEDVEWKNFIIEVDEHFLKYDSFDFYVGTNNYIEFKSKEHILGYYYPQNISDEEVETIQNLFDGDIFGTFLTLKEIKEYEY